MKTLLSFCFAVLLSTSLLAQEPAQDRITMNTGVIKKGQITRIDTDYVYFHHLGESIEYALPQKDINKIVFSSGRIEFFNPETKEADWHSRMRAHHNHVAVLPFEIKNKNFEGYDPQMSVQVQYDCTELFEQMTYNFTLKDPDLINATLREHGVTPKNVMEFLPSDLAHMLDVEYVIYGSVWITEFQGTEDTENYFLSDTETTENPQAARSTKSLSPKRFETIVDMNIYNEFGETAYTRVQESFWAMSDAYRLNLEYLIKHSPFYLK